MIFDCTIQSAIKPSKKKEVDIITFYRKSPRWLTA
jgi:hypothetical protein